VSSGMGQAAGLPDAAVAGPEAGLTAELAAGLTAEPAAELAAELAAEAALASLISARIRDVADYPQPGVIFKDITPLLADAPAFAQIVTGLAAGHAGVDKVAGIEARGFILAAPVACSLGAGFVPIRKQGKLPGPAFAQSYELEYGSATIEVHQDAFEPGDRVLIIDDVLATGGTAAASAELVRRCGATVEAIVVLLELGFLDGRSKLPGLPVRALLAL
jgi:adenine phosphoribosyltransferase